MGGSRRGGQRPRPVLPSVDRVRHRRAETAVAAGHAGRSARSAPTACPSRRPVPTPRRSTCKATAADGGYRINGAKAWITHGGVADFYSLFARTGEGAQGISCFLVDEDTDGLTFGKPEEKMGLHAIPTTTAHYDNAFVSARRRIGAEGQGLQIAFSALDSGRLGIAAVAVGLAQAALDEAVSYASSERPSAARSSTTKGWRFLLADMAAAVDKRARHVPGRGAPPRRGTGRTRATRQRGEADRHRRRDEGHHRRRPGVRRLRLHPGLPRRALHARGQDHPDLRGHQPDSATGHRSIVGRR